MIIFSKILMTLCIMAFLHFYNAEVLGRERSFKNLYHDSDSTFTHIQKKYEHILEEN